MNMTVHERYQPLTAKTALQLAAPHTWAASVLPALFGILYCWLRDYSLPPIKAVSLFLTCVLMQSAVNTLNDYFDFVKGTDSAEDNVEVSDAALIYAGIAPESAKRLGIGYLLTAAILGLSSCIGSGTAPILVGLFGGAMIVLYSGGPLPVSYLPVGEFISGFTMGGLIPLGIVACATGEIRPEVLLWSLPFIIGIALIMMSNNGCDIEKDIRAGRRTLPVLLGRERALGLYQGLTGLWLVLLVWMPMKLAGTPGIAGVLLLAVLGSKFFRRLYQLRLEPTKRIFQMKGILACNIFGNGAYIAVLVVGLILEVFHG